MSRRALVLLAAGIAALACRGSGGTVPNPCANGGGSCGAFHVSLAAVNSARAVAARAAARASTSRMLSAMAAPWAAGSIVSGPPDEMQLFLKEILVRQSGSDGAWMSVWTSPDAAGTVLSLTSGTLDLGQALGADLRLPAGAYRQVKLRLARVAKLKGCVSGPFRATNPVTKTITSSDMLGQYQPKHVGNAYTNDPIADGATHTFCTQATRSELAAATFSTGTIGSNADFEASGTPELTDVDVARGNDDGLSPDAIRAADTELSSPLTFSVVDGQQTRLTLAVDLNRQLRYFANTREDFNPPNPGMKTGTSYFFTTIFPDSVQLFPGDPGSIEGYALDVQAGSSLVKEWLTVIRDAGGAVVSGGVIPNDDNDLTVAKGSLDPAACSETSTDVWSLGFTLGTSSTGSFDGFAFQASVGDAATCSLTPLPNPSAPAGPYTVAFTREL